MKLAPTSSEKYSAGSQEQCGGGVCSCVRACMRAYMYVCVLNNSKITGRDFRKFGAMIGLDSRTNRVDFTFFSDQAKG